MMMMRGPGERHLGLSRQYVPEKVRDRVHGVLKLGFFDDFDSADLKELRSAFAETLHPDVPFDVEVTFEDVDAAVVSGIVETIGGSVSNPELLRRLIFVNYEEHRVDRKITPISALIVVDALSDLVSRYFPETELTLKGFDMEPCRTRLESIDVPLRLVRLRVNDRLPESLLGYLRWGANNLVELNVAAHPFAMSDDFGAETFEILGNLPNLRDISFHQHNFSSKTADAVVEALKTTRAEVFSVCSDGLADHAPRFVQASSKNPSTRPWKFVFEASKNENVRSKIKSLGIESARTRPNVELEAVREWDLNDAWREERKRATSDDARVAIEFLAWEGAQIKSGTRRLKLPTELWKATLIAATDVPEKKEEPKKERTYWEWRRDLMG